MKTTFQLVSKMNEAFNNPKGDPLNINWMRVQKQCLNIPDEVGELFAALGGHPKGSDGAEFIKRAVQGFKSLLAQSLEIDPSGPIDVLGVRDALCDIPVFATGAQHMMGVDGDRDMESVITGVMSRFVKDENDKQATIAKHAANGITEVYFEGEFPNMVMKSAVDQPDAPKGKFLKSASFQEAVFYDLHGCDSESEDADWDSPDREVGGELIDTDHGLERDEPCETCGLDDDCECEKQCYECDKSLEDCDCFDNTPDDQTQESMNELQAQHEAGTSDKDGE